MQPIEAEPVDVSRYRIPESISNVFDMVNLIDIRAIQNRVMSNFTREIERREHQAIDWNAVDRKLLQIHRIAITMLINGIELKSKIHDHHEAAYQRFSDVYNGELVSSDPSTILSKTGLEDLNKHMDQTLARKVEMTKLYCQAGERLSLGCEKLEHTAHKIGKRSRSFKG